MKRNGIRKNFIRERSEWKVWWNALRKNLPSNLVSSVKIRKLYLGFTRSWRALFFFRLCFLAKRSKATSCFLWNRLNCSAPSPCARVDSTKVDIPIRNVANVLYVIFRIVSYIIKIISKIMKSLFTAAFNIRETICCTVVWLRRTKIFFVRF